MIHFYKKNTLCFILLLFPFNVFAAKVDATFAGGLDIKKIQQCEKYYEKICKPSKAKTGGEEPFKKWSCVKEKMKLDQSCRQAYLIHDMTNYPPTELRSYPKGVAVFTITTLADGQTIFYIVDKKGQLINLADYNDENERLIKENPIYKKLKKHYPDLSFTDFIFWSVPFEDQFPKTSFDGTHIQLIFKQELRDGPCVACKPVAVAQIAYTFDAQGKFSGVKILKVEPLTKLFKR
jgi:hypothetical protein